MADLKVVEAFSSHEGIMDSSWRRTLPFCSTSTLDAVLAIEMVSCLKEAKNQSRY